MPSPHDHQPGNDLAANEFDLTDAETSAMTPEGEGAGADNGTPPAAATGQAEGTPAVEGAPAPAAPGAAEAAAATPDPAPAAATVAAPAAVPFVPQYIPDARDFDAELQGVNSLLTELRAKHSAGSIEDDAYEVEYERLQNQKMDLRIEQSNAKLRAELSQQNADQSWAYLQNQFFADPANAAIRTSGMLFASWEAAMQDVVNEAAADGRQVTDWDLMTEARKKMVEAGIPLPAAGGASNAPAPNAAPATPATPPKPDRTPPMGNVPQTLATAPSAADPGQRGTSDQLADIGDIEDIEDRLANMGEAQRDAVLRGTPGAFVG